MICIVHKLETIQVGPVKCKIFGSNCNGVEMAGDKYLLNITLCWYGLNQSNLYSIYMYISTRQLVSYEMQTLVILITDVILSLIGPPGKGHAEGEMS